MHDRAPVVRRPRVEVGLRRRVGRQHRRVRLGQRLGALALERVDPELASVRRANAARPAAVIFPAASSASTLAMLALLQVLAGLRGVKRLR